MNIRIYVGLICVIVLTGCNSSRAGKFGAGSLFQQPIEDIDMISILTRSEENSEGLSSKEFSRRFDKMLREYTPESPLERNRIQDRIILASNQLCEDYKVVLKRKQSRNNFWWGTAATVFGATGAVVTGVQAGKNFSALSGVSSGVRAEYNQSYFSDLAAQVISKGINTRRAEILQIISAARKEGLDAYTLEGALADAVTYHGACTLIAGLEQADTAITKLNTVDKVGLDALNANVFFEKSITNGK